MRRTRPSAEHQQAVSRRLELLTEQLAAERAASSPEPPVGPVTPARVDPAAGGDWWEGHTRVASRPLRLLEPAEEAPAGAWDDPLEAEPALVPARQVPPQPVAVPSPGRHAARRALAPRSMLPEVAPALVPETLRGRLRLGPAHLAVVALLVAVALAITCWRVVSTDAAPPVPAVEAEPAAGLLPVTGSEPSPPSPPSPPSAEAGAGGAVGGVEPTAPVDPAAVASTVTVDVAGEVRRPGIVVLDAGARVVDALEEAGGARPSVDLTSLNLARELVDGEQLLVGVEPPPGWTPGGSVPGATSGTTGVPGVPGVPAPLVDLNLAGLEELDTLPGVGPVTAAAILAWREENGGFSAVTELLEVDGIGDATLADLTPLVTV